MLNSVSRKNNADSTEEVVSPNRASRRKHLQQSSTLTGKITSISKSMIQTVTSRMPEPVKDRCTLCTEWADRNPNIMVGISLAAMAALVFVGNRLNWHTNLIVWQWPG